MDPEQSPVPPPQPVITRQIIEIKGPGLFSLNGLRLLIPSGLFVFSAWMTVQTRGEFRCLSNATTLFSFIAAVSYFI